MCRMPEDMVGSPLVSIGSSSLSCQALIPDNWLHLLLFALMLTSITVLIVIVCRFHDRLCCASKTKHKSVSSAFLQKVYV